MNLSWKYWTHHKMRAIALLTAIMSGVMAMTAGALFARSASQGSVEETLDITGNYDIAALIADDSELEIISTAEGIAQYETVIYGGVCKTTYSEKLRIGSMDKSAQKLFHYEPELGGRYPEAAGEVCGYRSSFQALGVAPVLGTQFEAELSDADGNPAGNRKFTITGVINDQKTSLSCVRSIEELSGSTDLDMTDTGLPELFVSNADLPDVCTQIALIRCEPDVVPHQVCNILNGKGISVADSGRINWLATLGGTASETENEVYEKAHLAYHDFYSSCIIPIFFAVILFVSFISVYGIISDAVRDRQKQMGLLRSLGMASRQVAWLLCREGCFFIITGVMAGYTLGILIYTICFHMANNMWNVRIYSAFGADKIACALSVDPFLWPWLLGILFSVLAAAPPLFYTMRRSPNEMLFPEKTEVASGRTHQWRKPLPSMLIRKVVHLGASGNAGVHALIFVTGWVFVFGAVFMIGNADYENGLIYQNVGDADDIQTDYIAHRNMHRAMCGNLNFNRHGEGISAEDMDTLAQSTDTVSAKGIIGLPGLKLLYQQDTPLSEIEKTIEPFNIDHNIDKSREDLFQKSKEVYGYAPGDRLYQLPIAAIQSTWLFEFVPYVIEGELDAKGLANGSKTVVIEYPDAQMENPFTVGDRLTMTEVIIQDSQIEEFDFSKGETPPGYKPAFSFTDANGTTGPGYAFGSKIVFETEVCAVLHIDHADIQRMLYAVSAAYDSAKTGQVSPGYQILCDSNALKAWKLPDKQFTDVYVDLAEDANIDRFESLWYAITSRSGDVQSISNADIRAQVRTTTAENLLLFAFMAALVLLAGCIGMANAYQFSVRRNTHNLQILRAVGMSRRSIILSHIREMFLWPFAATITAIIPISLFDIVRKYAYYYAFELGHNFSKLAENGKWVSCWQVRFPWYIEVWKQPVCIVILVGFLLMAGINIASGAAPVFRMHKLTIVDGIRNEDF